MSYREENGQVVLTLSHEDYSNLILALCMAAGIAMKEGRDYALYLEFMNRLSSGDPNFYPYELAKKQPQ